VDVSNDGNGGNAPCAAAEAAKDDVHAGTVTVVAAAVAAESINGLVLRDDEPDEWDAGGVAWRCEPYEATEPLSGESHELVDVVPDDRGGGAVMSMDSTETSVSAGKATVPGNMDGCVVAVVNKAINFPVSTDGGASG
jgi:hypothetical protein